MNVTRPGRRRSSAAAICASPPSVSPAAAAHPSRPHRRPPQLPPAAAPAPRRPRSRRHGPRTSPASTRPTCPPARTTTCRATSTRRSRCPSSRSRQDGTLKFDGAKVKPYVAKSWTLGKSSITFHLRKGVKFYGTNDVMTAEDVKFSLDRIFETPGRRRPAVKRLAGREGHPRHRSPHRADRLQVPRTASRRLRHRRCRSSSASTSPASSTRRSSSRTDGRRPDRREVAAAQHRRQRPVLPRQPFARDQPHAQGQPRQLDAGAGLLRRRHPDHVRQHRRRCCRTTRSTSASTA